MHLIRTQHPYTSALYFNQIHPCVNVQGTGWRGGAVLDGLEVEAGLGLRLARARGAPGLADGWDCPTWASKKLPRAIKGPADKARLEAGRVR